MTSHLLAICVDVQESKSLQRITDGLPMPEEKFICHQCVSENYVSKHISSNGNVSQRCSYCRRRRKNIPLEDIIKMMNEVFEYYYDVYEDFGLRL